LLPRRLSARPRSCGFWLYFLSIIITWYYNNTILFIGIHTNDFVNNHPSIVSAVVVVVVVVVVVGAKVQQQ